MSHHKYNFPEELLYENIAKEMEGKENFIANRGSVFPHGKVEPVKESVPCTSKVYSDEDIQKYISTLPDTFEDWLK